MVVVWVGSKERQKQLERRDIKSAVSSRIEKYIQERHF